MFNAPALRFRLNFLSLTLLLLALSVACSGNREANQNSDASADAGAVVFRLSWGGAPSTTANGYNAQLVTGDVCVDYNIQWIHARAVDSSGNEQSSGRWECSRNSGELNGLAAGIYDITIQGEVSEAVEWRGEVTGVQVLSEQQTDAGVITMVHMHDQTPPVVLHTLPVDGSQDVAVNTSLTARFDSAIVAHSVDADNFILRYNDSSGNLIPVACAVSYDRQSHTAVLHPLEPLLNNTAYTAAITIDQGSIVEDMAGNIMQQAVEWAFTTYRPDLEAPQIISRSPANGEMDVVLAPIVQIRFSEAIDPTTIYSNSIYLAHNGNILQSILGYDDQLHQVTLSPEVSLPAGATITAVVTTDLLDLAGNSMAADMSWSFVTQYPSWRNENIDAGLVSAATQITLEPNDTIHIGTSQGADGVMVEMTGMADNTWTRQVRNSSIGSGLNFGIVINNQDIRIITYLDFDQDLIFFELEGPRPAGGIAAAFVKQSNPVADVQGLQLASIPDGGWDGAGVVYIDTGNSQLKYAANATDWDYEVVVTAAVQYPALAMSSSGEAHVSYYDSASGQLKHAQRSIDGTWSIVTVDGETENVGLYTAITLDASGHPHMSYRDETNQSLKYAARLPSGQWLTETVDDSSDVGQDNSIALDSLGLAHISYQDDTANALKYAARSGIGSWHTQTVDTEDANGFGSSIAVDSQDYVHISYCYAMNMVAYSQLRYATTRPSD